MRAWFLHPIYFIWVIVPLAGYLALATFGWPHVIWTRSWHFSGSNQERFYTRCIYIGFNSEFTVHFPTDGQCSFLRFFKRGRDGA
jgi:hypothetical protein